MKALTGKILLFVPILLLAVMVNWYVDPARIFSKAEKKAEAGIVEIISSGKNVELYNLNFNDRLLQRLYVESLDEAPDILVFGSSRSMQLGSEYFHHEQSFYNASVVIVTLEDYLGLYQLYLEADLLPQRLILEIDPWLLKKKDELLFSSALSEEYLRAIERLSDRIDLEEYEGKLSGGRKYLELLSPTYFQASIKLLFLQSRQHGELFEFKSTDLRQAENTIRFVDGSREYNAKERFRPADRVRKFAIEYARRTIAGTKGKGKHNLDPKYLRLLELFVDDAQAAGVSVDFYLPSYHPAAYDILSTDSKYPVLTEIESFIGELALRKNITVFGSYDPSVLGLKESAFIDGNHMTRHAMANVFGAYGWGAPRIDAF